MQYCAMPVVQYPQLENELFCNIYYLRHLCDTVKFPDWPIKKPVSPVSMTGGVAGGFGLVQQAHLSFM